MPADFEWLQQKVDEHKAIYNKTHKALRNKIFAHKDIQSNATVHELFARTNIREWQTVTLFLQTVYNAVWQLYFNGMRLDLREHPPSVEDMLSKPIPAGRQVPAHEKVAHEVAQFLRAAARHDQ